MLIIYVAAAIAGGLVTFGTAWSDFGWAAVALAPLGASLAALIAALAVALLRSGRIQEQALADLPDRLVSSLRRISRDAAPDGPPGAARRRRAG